LPNVYAQFSKILLGVISAPVGEAFRGGERGADCESLQNANKANRHDKKIGSVTSDERCFAIGIMPRRKGVNIAPDTYFDLYSA
jgi:hypothetical protein